MSGIAEVLAARGHRVSGSDIVRSPITERLQRLGVRVEQGHAARHVGDADLVVVSSAVPHDNPECAAARARGIPVVSRGAMLAALARPYRTVAVVGSHGKTTTAAMAALALDAADLDPTVIIGGRVSAFGSGARLGRGRFMVVEADESDRSFLELAPEIAVLTNLDEEHLEAYGSMAELASAMRTFAARTAAAGTVIACGEDAGIRPAIAGLKGCVRTYAVGPAAADVQAAAVAVEPQGSRFEVSDGGRRLPGPFTVAVPGRHNVLNALAALAAALELDVPAAVVRRALAAFRGVDRRFEEHGTADGVRVIDDYAHHPTEIAAVLAAARRQTDGRVCVVFQPHRYTRTRRLLERFAEVLAGADALILTDVYAAGEAPLPGASAAALAAAVARRGALPVERVASLDEAVAAAERTVRRGDIVLTLGAGTIGRVPRRLLEQLRRRAAERG